MKDEPQKWPLSRLDSVQPPHTAAAATIERLRVIEGLLR
jgi:hypothetical protein